MAESAQEQLLGYLLDALDESERRALEDELACNPQLQQQLISLRAMVAPMESTRDDFDPPSRLAERTCRLVADETRPATTAPDPRPAPAGRLHAMREEADLRGDTARLSWFDVVAAAGIVVAATLLILPAIQSSRIQARSNRCAENLQNVYQGLAQYGDAFGGYLPAAPPNDRLAVGGGFAPVLHSAGYLTDPRQLLCPGSPLAELAAFELPSVESIQTMPAGDQLDSQLTALGGGYSMTLGYEQDGRFQGLRNQGRNDFALVSDVPDPRRDLHSHNHPGGQNILFEGGNIRFVTTPGSTAQGDHFFLNAAGKIGPGLNASDSVIPPAGPVPIVHVSNPW